MRLFTEIFKHYASSLDDAATFMPRLPDSNLEWLICVLLSVSQRFSIRFPPFPIGHQQSSKKPTEDVVYVHSFGTSNQTTLKHMQLSKVRKNKRANFFFPLAFLSFFSGDQQALSAPTTHLLQFFFLPSYYSLLLCYYCLITFPSCKTKNLEVRSSSKDAGNKNVEQAKI